MLCVMLSKDIKTPVKKNKIITFVKKKRKKKVLTPMNISTFKNLIIQKFLGRYELLIGFQTLGTK